MRVAIFIDAKYFYEGWRNDTGRQDLDFTKLASWIVKSVGGTRFMGAHYYAGVNLHDPSNPIQAKVTAFLDGIDDTPGFFVHRFEQSIRDIACESCGHIRHRTKAHGLDTSIVVDMIRLAAQNGFDIAVLAADDSDFAPALNAVRALGKQAWVANWHEGDIGSRLRELAFDTLDLRSAISEFSLQVGQGSSPLAELVGGANAPKPPPVFSNDPAAHDTAMVEEIQRAQAAMPGGFVGAHFLVTRWRSERLPDIPDFRRRTLDRVVAQGKAEVYLTEDGIQAVRLRGAP